MSTLELSAADDPYFGDHLFSTSHFLTWLDKQGLSLPVDPQIKSYQFLQAYALLSEIQAHAFMALPIEKTHAMVAKKSAYPENIYPPATRIQVSFDVQEQWRQMLIKAVMGGSLVLLDYASKLPLPPPDLAGPEDESADDRRRYKWEIRARSMAIEICSLEIAKTGEDPTQAKVARELVVQLRNGEVKTDKGKAISEANVMKALQPWTAPAEARKFLEKKKSTGF